MPVGIRGHGAAVLGKALNLTPYRFAPTLYDLIILGTPVWAGTFAPPLRTFLRANSLAGKHVALFACCSGGNAEKCFADMKKEVGNCTPLSTLRLIDPLKKNQADAAGSLAIAADTLAALDEGKTRQTVEIVNKPEIETGKE